MNVLFDSAAYLGFLQGKITLAGSSGFTPATEPHSSLKPHQRDLALWAIQKGCAAIFASFGLGKSRIQLQVMKWLHEYSKLPVLIVAPLGVKQEFTASDGPALGMTVRYCRTTAEVSEAGTPYIITNYERVVNGDIDVSLFGGVTLDETSVLRSLGSKTTQAFFDLCANVPYKFVATATPSPNSFKELLHYAHFLGVMDTGQALTRFFQRNSEKAGDLTLMPHQAEEFWAWLGSWAAFVNKPSDLGYSDEGYTLPKLNIHWHEVTSELTDFGTDDHGQTRLLPVVKAGLQQHAKYRAASLDERVTKAVEIVSAHSEKHWIVWHDLETERAAIERVIPPHEYNHWVEIRDGDPRGLALYERHYSAYQYADGRERKLFCGPGEKTVLLSKDNTALFVWRKFIDDSGQRGVNCAVFRNEGEVRSSDLIREAMAIARLRWPSERFYTYVNAQKVRSSNPGYCFLQAGWSKAGTTRGGLIILEALVNVEVPDVTSTPLLRTVYGSQDLDTREELILGFARGEYRVLATKPSIAGSGCNFQHHCADAVFVGVDFKFNDIIQAVHRIYRFLQTEEVNVHFVYSDLQHSVRETLLKKWAQHEELTRNMQLVIRKHGLSQIGVGTQLSRRLHDETREVVGDRFRLIHGDCVLETSLMPDDSVHEIVTSIPFSNHYEYTPSYNDFGHNEDDAAFFEQMGYLIPELYRILKPGRVAAIHVKDRIEYGNVTGVGMYSVNPFSDKTVEAFKQHGFTFCGRVTVDTDVVRENAQTYRLGWSENAKDSTKMGVGSTEYVLLFRKWQPSMSLDNTANGPEPVTKDKEHYTRSRWQVHAAGIWRSSGNRLLDPAYLKDGDFKGVLKAWKEKCRTEVYDLDAHIAQCEVYEREGRLPSGWMLFAPHSPNPDVWTDIMRARTLNTNQSQKATQNHVCPLQLDVIKRLIERYSNLGDVIFDPFSGIGSVPYQALKMGRRGLGTELNPEYWSYAVGYCEGVETQQNVPTLFDFGLERVGAAL